MTAIDLRSDTVTKPTDEMRRAMAAAEVGDDVFGEDPSINELQERSAALLGKEAGLLTSSGTMSNLIATLAWSSHGDEIIMGDEAHMFWNEGAGQAALGGVQTRLVPNDPQGRINPIRRGRRHPPAGQPALSAHQHGLPGEHPQPLQRRGADARGYQVRQRRGPRRRGAGTPGRRPHLQRRRRPGSAPRRTGPRRGRPELLPVQVAELPRRVGAGGVAGLHRQREALAQDAGRRNAAGG